MNIITSTAITAASSLSAQDPGSTGVLDWVDDKTTAVTNTLTGVIVLAGIIVGLYIAWKGKSVGATIMAVLVGGLIAALPFLISFFSQRAVGETAGMDMDTTSQMLTYAHGFITTRI